MRALFRIGRWPSLAVAALASAAILGCATAVAPMFLTAAGSEVFRSNATRLRSVEALQLRDFDLFIEEYADYRDRLLAEQLPDGLTAPIATAWGEPVRIVGPSGIDNTVRAVTRTGMFEHNRLLTEAAPRGVWVTDYNAREMDLEAGDSVTVMGTDARVELEIAGLYRDPLKDPVTDFWGPIRDIVYPDAGEDVRPPPPLLLDRGSFFSLARRLGDDGGEYRWEFALAETDLTLSEVEDLNERVVAFDTDRLDPTTELGAAFGRANVVSQVNSWADITRETVVAITGPVETLALGGSIVAAIIVAGTAFFTVNRRRTEFNLLHARGISPVRLGLRSAVEALLPLVVGAALGWGLAIVFVRSLGPPGLIDPSALADAGLQVAWRTGVAAVLFGVGATVAVRLLAHESFGRLGRAARLPWEPVVLVLAGAAFYELTQRGDVSDAGSIDRLAILFPILFIAGAAGLVARLLRRALPRMRSAGAAWHPSLYLASRRLAAAVRSATALVTASAIAVGMFFYAAMLSTSTEATADQRALLQVGAQSSADVSRFPAAVDSDGAATTPVVRFSGATVLPGSKAVDVLAIDPRTFASAAYWDAELSGRSLEELMETVSSPASTGIPVVVAGDAGDPDVLSLSSYDIPVAVGGRAEAFPGMVGQRPTVVIATEELRAQIESAGGSLEGIAGRRFQVWSDGPVERLERALEADGQSPFGTLTAAQLRDTPAYLALTWTFGLMEALGALIGVVVLLGMLLYLQTRQKERQVSYALGRRMGLGRASHRAAIGIEVGAMLVFALLIGAALALTAVAVMHDRVVFTSDGAIPLLRVPVLLLTAAATAFVGFAWASAWLVQRAADRIDVARVMRLAR